MTKLHYSVSSCTYKSGIFQGFSRLQQSDEFVDMTLAAEGHLVKVHQTLVALASPYLKNMLLSIPCRHPVIFLNGITREVLGFILEYIYTGEVEIPAEKVQTFLSAAQAMHISGLKNTIPPTEKENPSLIKQTKLEFQEPQQPHHAAKPIFTMQSDNNVDLQLQESSIELPDIKSETENQTKSQLPFNIDVPMSLKDEIMENINTCSNSINTSNNVSNDYTRKKAAAKIDIVSNIAIQGPLPELNETDGQIPLNVDIPISLEQNKEFNNLRNIYTHKHTGKTINISYNHNVNVDNDSQKPVANIEIVSNILPNDNVNAINNQGLPQLYADALANMKKVIGNDISMDGSVSQLQTISNQLCAQQSNPVPEPTESDNIDFETNENFDIAEDKASVYYTASNRGSLQLILNKFVYNCHYQRDNGRKRRWRCIDYRDFHCPASVDTEGERIIKRKLRHSHPNHEKKIEKKVMQKKSKIFSAIQVAEDILKNHKSDTS